jgi:hypothetical protein
MEGFGRRLKQDAPQGGQHLSQAARLLNQDLEPQDRATIANQVAKR